MKQLTRHRVAVRRSIDRRRDRTANPEVLAELSLIAEVRRSTTSAGAPHQGQCSAGIR